MLMCYLIGDSESHLFMKENCKLAFIEEAVSMDDVRIM